MWSVPKQSIGLKKSADIVSERRAVKYGHISIDDAAHKKQASSKHIRAKIQGRK